MQDATFRCDVTERLDPLVHSWELCVGSCHAPLALRSDWQAQLARAHRELGFRAVRFHGILSDDMGTLVRHERRLHHSFHNADTAIEAMLGFGVRPFVELSFMPTALASGSKTVFRYAGNITPPRSFPAWGGLVTKLVSHWVDRFGREEVERWWFEVWNEPNLEAFWTGTQGDYFRLYGYAARAIKGVAESLRVGGPATAANAWITDFVSHCERRRVPLDFVTTHHYPTDAFGSPGDDTIGQLAASRRGILREQAQNARGEAGDRPLYYTEWNSSSNSRDPLHDEPYAAAFAAKSILDVDGVVDGYAWWTFSDIFEENVFPSQPFHGGFGLLTLHGIAKPTYRAFELLHRLGTERLLVDGHHPTVDVWVVRGDDRRYDILLTNHALPTHPIDRCRATVRLVGAGPADQAFVERIDDDHAHAKKTWIDLGSPEHPTAADLDLLHAASRLVREPLAIRSEEGDPVLVIDLAPHSVTLVTVPGPRSAA